MSHLNFDDLQIAYREIQKLYQAYSFEYPVLGDFIWGNKWCLVSDKNTKSASAALKISHSRDVCLPYMLKLYGIKADAALEILFSSKDNVRILILAILNLLSKKLNSAELLKSRGILRTAGRKFEIDVTGKKVGLIGYGLYIKNLYHKCEEFHAFDIRSEEEILSYHTNNGVTEIYPKDIIFHLGRDATEFSDILSTLDIVIMSGSTIVNKSYLKLLNACKNCEVKGIYGPSSELLPDYLLNLGYHYIFSASIRNIDEYIEVSADALSEFKEFEHMDLYEAVRL